ncbi:MAG: sigma-54-dependent transcriptional regulator [Nitrospiria bacterium]
MIRIQIVDDKESMRHSLARLFSEKGHEVIESASGEEALGSFQETESDLVITDLQMGGMTGLDLLREIKKRAPLTQVMVITAFGTVESAVEAMRQGAFDYLLKPFSLAEIETKADKALEQRRLLTENRFLRETIQGRFGKIIGHSPKMQQVYRLIEKVAPNTAPVLILGETGTGKELVAREIHNKSPRAERPFVTVNCGAIPENLIESELFGHEKGAFTGAVTSKKGRFELAEGGTLFLDEIGELPLHLQVKLLRFIQERELERVGGTKTTKVDVRLIAATHRDLKEEVQARRFREDLYYRIRVIEIHLPPLREREEDIVELGAHFLRKFNHELHKDVQFPSEIIDLFSAYHWPGNIRELENMVERAVVLADGDTIRIEDLPSEIHSIPAPIDSSETPSETKGMADRIEAMEREMIRKTMEETQGNQTQAAKILGLHRSSLQYKLRKYGLLSS